MSLSLLLLALASCIAFAGCQVSRAGYTSAPYKVISKDGNFELRDYPRLTVVETAMNSTNTQSSDGSFMRLFRFIGGANETHQKISMTTPVFMSSEENKQTMAFVMPADMKISQTPKPTDAAVTVRELPKGRFAVMRYSGARSSKNEARSLAKLTEWTKTKGVNTTSSPVYGYFDPPWTPSFFRRNEVMLRIGPDKK